MRTKIPTGIILSVLVLTAFFFIKNQCNPKKTSLTGNKVGARSDFASKAWIAPDSNSIPATKEGKLIRYGRKLITHTSIYLGPKGTVAHVSNGMNCQNCHLFAGTKSFGNNFSMVASGYPRFRPRSGRIESIEFRVNDCLVRSLNQAANPCKGKILYMAKCQHQLGPFEPIRKADCLYARLKK